MQLNNLPETGFLRINQVLALFPIGKSTWYAGILLGKYPKGVKIGARATAWRIEDIKALIKGVA